ncbi:MAG: MotA/TolQ/ExbB proton channel family protein [Firmicutes bacterium]|nr:MotA/TolQ/ExbB proton channel family protein [Bacillota bacterium]
MSEVVKGILRVVSSGLQIPTIIILILLILLTIFMLGTFFAELLTERKSLKLNIPKLVDELQGKSTSEMKDIIATSSLLTRQKTAVQELISRVTYPDDTREALARQLIADEESRYNRIIKITDLTARVAPMFGLMGTLIPLGPGLIALGEGDAATLSESLLIAFDTTVAGLISGAISYVVSGFRKGWYEEYMIGLETIMETVLDVQNTERRKALQQKKAADAAKAAQTGRTSGAPAASAQTAASAAQAQTAAPAASAQTAASAASAQTAAPAQAAPAARAQAAPAAQRPAARAQAAPAAQPASRNTVSMTREQLQQAAQAQPARAAQVTAKPTLAQATSKTIAGYDGQQLQAEVRAAEEAMRRSEEAAQAEAAIAKEMDQIRSLDELLESFAPTDGRN